MVKSFVLRCCSWDGLWIICTSQSPNKNISETESMSREPSKQSVQTLKRTFSFSVFFPRTNRQSTENRKESTTDLQFAPLLSNFTWYHRPNPSSSSHHHKFTNHPRLLECWSQTLPPPYVCYKSIFIYHLKDPTPIRIVSASILNANLASSAPSIIHLHQIITRCCGWKT